jgi:hypothetical protein
MMGRCWVPTKSECSLPWAVWYEGYEPENVNRNPSGTSESRFLANPKLRHAQLNTQHDEGNYLVFSL